ncbi:MAG: MFS transporter [Pseudomonadota bacterium]
MNTPLVGTLKAWQATFVIVGLPGLLVAGCMLLLKEPARIGHGGAMPLRTVLAYARTHWRVYSLHFFGFAMLTLLFNGTMAWAAEYFIRIHNVARATIGPQLGILTAVFGGSGIVCGGLYCDHLAARGYRDAPMRAALTAAVILLPFAVAAPLAGDPTTALVLFAPLLFFVSFTFGPAAAGVQLMTPPAMRAQMSAVYLFVVNLAGIGFGPTAVALLTDYIFADDMKLHWSMTAIATAGSLLAILLLWLALKPFAAATREAEQA